MPLSDVDVKAFLCAAHVFYWLLITNGSVVRRRKRQLQNQEAAVLNPTTGAVVATQNIYQTKAADIVYFFSSITYGAFYILLWFWWFNPASAGPFVLQPSLTLQLAGVLCIAVALTMKISAFWVFGSWRLYGHIEKGHQLVTAGPYGLVRHPLYTAFHLLFLGSFLIVPQLGFLLQFLANFITHDIRTRFEEKLLVGAFGDNYLQYRKQTPGRLIPWVY
jgi:protein-S-isoprenylcysteine O-methyltransferase Ste14